MGNRSKRTLHDLYVLGQTVTFLVPPEHQEPGDGDTVVVWVQKLDPLDHDSAVRKAKAARARRRAVLADHDHDDYLELLDTLQGLGRDAQITLILGEDDAELEASARSELQLGEDSEWAKDGYLEGLLESWNSGLQDRYGEDADDPEALRVLAELTRFSAELEAVLAPQRQDRREMIEQLPQEEIERRALEQLIERDAQMAFLDEFIRSEAWLSTRRPCKLCLKEVDGVITPEPHQARHDDFYFNDRADIDRLEPTVLSRLQAVYQDLAVDPVEGKDSRATGDSSASSASPEPAETAPSSGQLVAVG